MRVGNSEESLEALDSSGLVAKKAGFGLKNDGVI
jgi:hypothetical protein